MTTKTYGVNETLAIKIFLLKNNAEKKQLKVLYHKSSLNTPKQERRSHRQRNRGHENLHRKAELGQQRTLPRCCPLLRGVSWPSERAPARYTGLALPKTTS
jgi:hypothetical protein